MNDERWQRVKALFQDAVERPPDERDAFLTSATAGDEELRREVESLLASDANDRGLLDHLPVASETVVNASTSPEARPVRHTLSSHEFIGSYEVLALLGHMRVHKRLVAASELASA